ncbi:MAG TPA: hypothetical protein PKN50_18505 [Spirochaetota bacterium]|nr:hypothetical protein [Spirochaetota bacterium]HPV41175.1 hypothetical protein [Spirochaetota bacterium]
MNQDKVKELLLQLDSKVEDFSVILSGKASKKVDGLYYPDSREIIIHNKNFTDDNQLIYTAIHEFAHHLHHTRSAVPVSSRAHTNRFWDIFHKLLFLAEEKGIYLNVFKQDSRFIELTGKIKSKYLSVNGALMKELGSLLEQAHALCEELNLCYDDYVDRELLLHRTTARLLMKINAMNINPKIGFENMKTVANIRDEDARERAEAAFGEGMTPDMVRAEFSPRNKSDNALSSLMEERDRIERSIDTLTKKLAKIERKINEMKYEAPARSKK